MIEIRSLRDLLRLLFIYQREFKLAALSAVVIIVLGAFLLPAKYESNARLLVKPGRDSTLPIEISNRQALVMPSTQRDPIVDEERLLTGRPIVRQVAERYLEVLANRPPPEGLWKRTKFYVKKAIGAVFDGIRVTLETFGVIEETTAVERLAKDLEKKFEVTHAAGSTVMEISFTWSEPEVAQEVVKAWIEIYMEERTQALGRKSLYAFYEAQTADSAAQIKSYKAQILKHLNEIGASSIEDRLQDLSERINVLRGERFNSIRLIASSDSALESTRQQLKGLPREIVTVRQIALNPAQQDLRRLLNQKRLERADMMRTYTDDAPPVKALDASIRALEKEVQDEGATVQSSEDRAPNTLTTHLERVLLDETSNNAALRTQLAEQEKQLAELEAQRREALDIEPTLARLQRELNATERNYALYVDSLEKSRIDRELDKSQISNISVIEEATYNPGRIFPKTLLMLFLAVPFGLAVGLLVVYLCYLLDQRIHDGGLVEEKFGLPLWTTLPELSNSTAESSNAFTASIYRLYGLLPYARIEEKGLTLGLTSARHGEGVTFIIEQLRRLLEENGVRVRIGGEPAQPGEVVLLDAPALLDSREAFIALRRADLIALVVERSTGSSSTGAASRCRARSCRPSPATGARSDADRPPRAPAAGKEWHRRLRQSFPQRPAGSRHRSSHAARRRGGRQREYRQPAGQRRLERLRPGPCRTRRRPPGRVHRPARAAQALPAPAAERHGARSGAHGLAPRAPALAAEPAGTPALSPAPGRRGARRPADPA